MFSVRYRYSFRYMYSGRYRYSFRLLDIGAFTVNGASNIKYKDFRSFSSSVMLKVPPPLDSETGWTGELWSKTKGSQPRKNQFFFGHC